MDVLRIRPSFQETLQINAEALRDRLVRNLRQAGTGFEVRTFPGFVALRIPEAERHFWSPRLNISLEEGGPENTTVHGFYGPNANVWSLFLFGYLFTGMSLLIAGMFSLSQLWIGQAPWGLWVLGGAFFGLCLLRACGGIGEKLGAEQTRRLHSLYETAIGHSVALP